MRDLEKKLLDHQVQALAGADPRGLGPTLTRHQDEVGQAPAEDAALHQDLAAHLARPDEGPFHPPRDPRQIEEQRRRWGAFAASDALSKPRPINEDHADESSTGQSAKTVVHTGQNRFLLKPYHGETFQGHNVPYDLPMGGWKEMTTQALYHAAGMGANHQRVHVTQYGGKLMLAVHLDPELREHHDAYNDDVPPPRTEAARDAGERIATMDWLTANDDRHGRNLMLRPDGTPVAIDHGLSFLYGADPTQFDRVRTPLQSIYAMQRKLGGSPHHLDLGWWRQAGPAVRAAFGARLKLVKHRALRQFLRQGFALRADRLDSLAANSLDDKPIMFNKQVDPVIVPGMPYAHDVPGAPRTQRSGVPVSSTVLDPRLPEALG